MRQPSLIAFLAAWGMLAATSFLAADEVQDAFERLFGEEARQVTATPDHKDDAEFAARLLKAAESIPAQSPLRILMCEKAYEFALRGPAGYATALDAVARLAAAAPDRKEECDDKTLAVRQLMYRDAKPGDEKTWAGQALLEALLPVADARCGAGRFTDAASLYRQAQAVAVFLRSPQAEEVQARFKAATARIPTEQLVGQLTARLKTNPEDKAAAAHLFQLLLVEMGKVGTLPRFSGLPLENMGSVPIFPLVAEVSDWRRLLLGEEEQEELDLMRRHSRTGRPLGDVAFTAGLERRLDRPLTRGKPGPKPKRRRR